MERPLPHITKNGGKTIKCEGECEGHQSGRGLKLISKNDVMSMFSIIHTCTQACVVYDNIVSHK